MSSNNNNNFKISSLFFNIQENLNFLDFVFFAPEFFIILCSVILFLVTIIFFPFRGNAFDRQNTFEIVNSLSITSVFLVLALYVNMYSIAFCNYSVFNWFFYSTFFLFFFKSFVCFLVFCYLISISNFFEENFDFEFNIFVLVAFFAIQLFLSSFHLISLYLCLELQSFCYYVMSSYRRNSVYSAEAGLKFFILNSFASAFILFGLSLCYLNFGTFEIRYVSHFFFFLDFDQIPLTIFVSLIMIVCGFLFKLGIVPFHTWLPDVYDGSPFISTSFFSMISKLPPLIVFLNFMQIFFAPTSFLFSKAFVLFSIFSIVIGSFSALFQVRLKRFLAYSSISQMGFILLTISYDAGFASIQVFLFYVIIYFVLNLTLFCCLLAYYNPSQNRKISTIYDLSGIYNYNKLLAIILVFTLFSMAGIPPLAGFASKYFLIFKISEFEPSLTLPFLFLIVVTSSISVFYYIRIITLIFFEPDAIAERDEDDYDDEEELILLSKYEPGMVPFSKEPSMPYFLALFLVICFYFNLFFMFFTNVFFNFIRLLSLYFFLFLMLFVLFAFYKLILNTNNGGIHFK